MKKLFVTGFAVMMISQVVAAQLFGGPIDRGDFGRDRRDPRDSFEFVGRQDLDEAINLIYRGQSLIGTSIGERDAIEVLIQAIQRLQRNQFDPAINQAVSLIEDAIRIAGDNRVDNQTKRARVQDDARRAAENIVNSNTYRQGGGHGPGPGPGPGPGRDELIGQFYGHCIGGAICGGPSNTVRIHLGRAAHVDRIEFFAHDNIGNKHKAIVNVYADGRLVGAAIDIKVAGNVERVRVGGYVSTIEIRPANNDESEIGEIRVFGSRR